MKEWRGIVNFESTSLVLLVQVKQNKTIRQMLFLYVGHMH